LKNDAEFAAQQVDVFAHEGAQVESRDFARARFEGQRGIEGLEEAAFAATGLADEVGKFALADAEADVLEDVAAVRLADVGVGKFYDVWHALN
jgi:hypothetical protein